MQGFVIFKKAPVILFILEKIVSTEKFQRYLIGCLEDWELEKTENLDPG